MSILDLAVEIVQDLALTNESGCTLSSLSQWYGAQSHGVDMIRHCLIVLSDCGVLMRRESWVEAGSYEYRVSTGMVKISEGEKVARADLSRVARNLIAEAPWTKQDKIARYWQTVDSKGGLDK